jgi:hypothetical protein
MVATVKNEISNGPTLLFHDAAGDRSQTMAALREGVVFPCETAVIRLRGH